MNLGHATDADIKAAIKGGIQFGDMFAEGDPANCDTANGFTLVAPGGAAQCLKIKSGQKQLASRLESRRYAAIMGATHEFRKMEGFTYDDKRDVGYIAISEAARAMLNNVDDPEKAKNYDFDGATGNHIQLDDANYCGGVYSMSMQAGIKDTAGALIASNTL